MATIKLASPTKFKSAPPATIPVFIENTRELTGFDLDQGASLTLAHLRGMVARKLGVAPSTVTCKLYKNVMDLNMRLCQIPDGVVVQVYTSDERYESGLNTNNNNNNNSNTSSVTTPLSSSRGRTLDNTNNVTFANQSQVTAIYNAENAPTTVEKAKLVKLPKFNPDEKYAGTQAVVDLTLAGPNTSIKLNKADGATLSLARKEEPKRNLTRDVTIKVALEGGAPTFVTVANDTTVTDLRIRCNVEMSEFPSSMCGDRRILVEQTSFKELCVGDGATLTFSTRTPQDWGDSDAAEEMMAGASRYTKSSGGKNMSIANSSAFAKSPAMKGNLQNTSLNNNYSSSRETAYATSFYNNMNNNNNNNNNNSNQNSFTSPSVNRSGRIPPPQYLDHQQYDPVPTPVHNNVGAAAAFLSAMNPQDLLNQSTKSESSAYGAPILSPQRHPNSGTGSRASSTSRYQNQNQQNSFVTNSPSMLTAPHVSPVTPHYNNNNSFAYQQPSYAYYQNDNNTGDNNSKQYNNANNSQNRSRASQGNNNTKNVVVYPNPKAMSIDQQISFFNSNNNDYEQQQQSYSVPGEPIMVQPIGGPQRIGSAMTDKNFSLINVNNSARGKAYYSPGSAEEMRIQEENTDFTGSSPVRRRTNIDTNNDNSNNTMTSGANNRTFASASVRAVITPAQQRNSSLRDKFAGATKKSNFAAAPGGFDAGRSDDLSRPLPDSPSHKNWISHNLRAPTVTQRSSEEEREAADRCFDAMNRGVFLNLRFEDPTDDHFTHELRVWSLHPCSFLFSFAGDHSEEEYHLLCDGQIILYPSANFGAVTKGVDQCLFSFARKQ